MSNWKLIDDSKEDYFWNFAYKEWSFCPNEIDVIKFPNPNRHFNLSEYKKNRDVYQ